MGQLKVFINNKDTIVGEVIPTEINSLIIIYIPLVIVPHNKIPLLKGWLNNIIDSLKCTHITFNNILIPTTDLRKF